MTGATRILVWDLPTRVFHWLLVASFAGAWLTSEAERFLLVHALFGYTVALLIVFRVLWGFVGTRYARFAEFVRGPAHVLRYLFRLVTYRPERHVGHNPAGGWAIVALLTLGALTSLSGWPLYVSSAGHWLEELHEGLAVAMLALVVLHVAAVLATGWLRRERLVSAMLNGYKPGAAQEAISGPHRLIAAVLVAAVGALWVALPQGALPWLSAPALTENATGHDGGRRGHRERDDD